MTTATQTGTEYSSNIIYPLVILKQFLKHSFTTIVSVSKIFRNNKLKIFTHILFVEGIPKYHNREQAGHLVHYYKYIPVL